MDKIEGRLWDIECTGDTFNTLRSDERFLGLLTLARFVNALRFCQQPVIDARHSDSPSASRQTINSFLFASSVLYEGFLLIKKLPRPLREYNSFKEGFGILLRDKNVIVLRTSVLKRMRNKFVFHFDRTVAQDALKDFDLPYYRFSTCLGEAAGEMYFGLADEAVMNYLLQPKPEESDIDLTLRNKKMTKDITDLMGKFTVAAEKLMTEALVDMGWTSKIRE